MFYNILCDGLNIYDTTAEGGLLNPKLELEANEPGTLTFTMIPSHAYYNFITPCVSEVEVYERGELIFFGRVLDVVIDFNNNKKVTCEGALGYLYDTVQKPAVFDDNTSNNNENEENDGEGVDPSSNTQTTIHDFFTYLITEHNKLVTITGRQFKVGTINLTNKTISRELNYEKTMECIKQQCVESFGGYLFVRKEDDGNYIDWLRELSGISNQPIQYALNLTDLTNDFKGSDMVTSIIPIGDDGLDVSGKDSEEQWINKRNPGQVYIDSDAVETYGRVLERVEFSGITDAETLYEYGLKWLEDKQYDISSIEVSSADLSYFNDEYSVYKIGQSVHVTSAPHSLDANYPIVKISYNLDSPVKKITIGTPERKSLTDQYAAGGGGGSSSNVSRSQAKSIAKEEAKVIVGESKLADLEDTDFNYLSGGQVLKYDEVNQVWFNGDNVTGYEELENLPSINEVTLIGDKTSEDLGIVISLTQEEYDELTEEEKNDPNKVYYIEDDIGYDSGIQNYKETVLWNSRNGASIPTSVTLNDDINHYDAFFVVASMSDSEHKQYKCSQIIPVSSIDKSGNTYFGLYPASGSQYYSYYMSYASGTALDFAKWGSNYGICIYKIVGIKYGMTVPVIYSDEEREIGVWRDGKPLYQKTIDCGLMPNDTNWHDVPHNITDLDKVIRVEGNGQATDNTQFFSYPAYRPSLNVGSLVFVYNDKIRYMNNWHPANTTKLYVTVYYTKTSDQPGSAQYTTLGTPEVHYSTDEQIIGTWVDGSTLYKKTVIIQPTALSQGTTINHGISNIDKVVHYDVIMDRNSNNSFIDFTYVAGSGTAGSFRVFKTYFEYNGTDSWTGSEYSAIYVTVQYTKTS